MVPAEEMATGLSAKANREEGGKKMDKFRVEVKKVEHSKESFNSCFKRYKWRDFHVPQHTRDVLSLHSGEEHKPSNWLQEEHTKKPQPVTYKISINWHSTLGSFLTRWYKKKTLKSKIQHWNQLSSSEFHLMFIIQHRKIRTDYFMKWQLAVGWSSVLSFGTKLLLQKPIHGNLSFNVASRCPSGNFLFTQICFLYYGSDYILQNRDVVKSGNG